MAFQRAQMTKEAEQWVLVVAGVGEWQQLSMMDADGDDAEVTERLFGFGGRLSAPGYMDCTSWCVGETQADVARQLLELYFDQPEDEMDDEEIKDCNWLCEFLPEAERARWQGE